MSAESIQATREKELARKAVGSLPSKFSCRVVGVSFVDGYPQNLYRLEQDALNAGLFGNVILGELRAEPDNPHDPNAVAVYVDGEPIGHLTRPLAARITNPDNWHVRVEQVLIGPSFENPGVSIFLQQKGST